MRVPPRQQPNGYRGRRRLPKLPSKRYAGVVLAAFVGAAIVVGASWAVVAPGPPAAGAGDPTKQALTVDDRLNAVDRANRSQDRDGPAFNLEQRAPDVWLIPLRAQFQITSLYGPRWGTLHPGIDLAAPYGTPYYAAHAGVVTLAAWDSGYGNCVRVDVGGGIETVYGHASRLLVAQGQKVQAGQVLGLVGSTGDSTGNHLHFEINLNGVHSDPMAYLMAHGVDVRKRIEEANGGTVIP
jgi:murein DD-endopeptidase MepM/ murein hydrolase activator NlpD